MPTFKVKATRFGTGSIIEMDGKALENVLSFEVRVKAGNATVVIVQFLDAHVEIEAQKA